VRAHSEHGKISQDMQTLQDDLGELAAEEMSLASVSLLSSDDFRHIQDHDSVAVAYCALPADWATKVFFTAPPLSRSTTATVECEQPPQPQLGSNVSSFGSGSPPPPTGAYDTSDSDVNGFVVQGMGSSDCGFEGLATIAKNHCFPPAPKWLSGWRRCGA